jgi:hypothetical protein
LPPINEFKPPHQSKNNRISRVRENREMPPLISISALRRSRSRPFLWPPVVDMGDGVNALKCAAAGGLFVFSASRRNVVAPERPV